VINALPELYTSSTVLSVLFHATCVESLIETDDILEFVVGVNEPEEHVPTPDDET